MRHPPSVAGRLSSVERGLMPRSLKMERAVSTVSTRGRVQWSYIGAWSGRDDEQVVAGGFEVKPAEQGPWESD